MTLAERLADLALAPLGAAEGDRLRALTLGNVAAGLGDIGSASDLVWNLPRDRGEGADAHRLAMLLHARTQDDFYPAGRTHVGVLSLAPALVLSERDHLLMPALAAGYRVMCATSAAYSAVAQARGLRPSSMFGPLGAAASAAVALGAGSRSEVAGAIGLAACMAGGTNQAWIAGTDEWLLEVGAAARAGVEAARFAAAGARAAAEAIEGRAGWAAAFFDDPEATRLVRLLDEPPPLTEAVAAKPYPVSGIAQVPTDLACQAHRQLEGRPVTAARLRVSEAEGRYPGSQNRGPFTSRSDALMSLALCVACGLLDGVIGVARLEDANVPEMAAMIERVSVELDSALPETEAHLEVQGGDRTFRLTGSGSAILYAGWAATAARIDDLALRSEASEALVLNAYQAVAASEPSGGPLLQLVGRR